MFAFTISWRKLQPSSQIFLCSQILCQSAAIKCWKRGENGLIMCLTHPCTIKDKHNTPLLLGNYKVSSLFSGMASIQMFLNMTRKPNGLKETRVSGGQKGEQWSEQWRGLLITEELLVKEIRVYCVHNPVQARYVQSQTHCCWWQSCGLKLHLINFWLSSTIRTLRNKAAVKKALWCSNL